MKNQLTKFLNLIGLTDSENEKKESVYIQDNIKRKIEYLSIEKIASNPYQSRFGFDKSELIKLAASIEKYGIINPLIVRENGNTEDYELVTGERRLKAGKLLGLTEVPVIIGEFEEYEMAEIILLNNLQRRDLDFLEEALGYQQLLNNFELGEEELANKLCKHPAVIKDRLRLLELPGEVLRLTRNSKVSEGHARALLELSDKELQTEVIKQVIENEYTVEELKDLIREILDDLNEYRDKKKVIKYFNDARLALNTIRKTVQDIKSSGLDIEVEEREQPEEFEINIRLSKK
ncbi:ParB/RepB/Spo0J family partition protein [Acetohalobium arabaticum]|uniref:ParB-like partition protein n=1 Tax=Acetohalobium arabaticum (strain ATCC 49924 / DSM 5501 / Z-7288) TaxID=574087 RepID=D9QUM4_ACEAZ|nr:ParB/RepB/Spo0J family partition protein [Acetohalobium arabaticum]ADL13825.1 parB-like partition protein [Acetohalobium arabaticum DSM 5501]